jgi:UDP:flavonoid glycosyltransferase YjiC (YdhE family)
VLEKERFHVPDNVSIVASAPHSEVFPLADLVITHAGHGTIMRALAHGLPVICLPMGRDQNDNAIKVEHHGCGIALNAKAGPGKIRKAVRKILSEDSFRQAACSFRMDILGCDPGASVLREIENMLDPADGSNRFIAESNIRYA